MLSLPLDNAVKGSSFFDVVVFFTLSTVYQRVSLFTNYLYFIQFLDNPIIRLELMWHCHHGLSYKEILRIEKK